MDKVGSYGRKFRNGPGSASRNHAEMMNIMRLISSASMYKDAELKGENVSERDGESVQSATNSQVIQSSGAVQNRQSRHNGGGGLT